MNKPLPPPGARRIAVWRMLPWIGAAALWLLPLAAMQVSDEVDWTAFDFIVWGVMLLAAAGAYDLATRMRNDWTYRIAMAMAVGGAFVLVWINLAVGFIGNENNPANLMFAGVIAVGVIGAVLARFRPDGMARALIATAIAQAVVGVIALAGRLDSRVLFPTAVFVVGWLAAALLFRRATERDGS